VRELLDPGGAVTDALDLDAFGGLLQATGSTANPYRLHGQYRDDESDLYYMRARWYDARTGRFVGTDPKAGDVLDPPTLHRYQFSRQDPINFSDPTGRESLGAISLSQSIASNVDVRPVLIRKERATELPEISGSCETCEYVVERIKNGANLLLSSICSDLRKKSPEEFADCKEVLHALAGNASDLRSWLFEGCYLYDDPFGGNADQKVWVKPCPSRVICSTLRELNDKPFCGAGSDPFADSSPGSSGNR